MRYAWNIKEDEIYQLHPDLFDNDEFDTVLSACRVLGRKADLILDKSEKVRNCILEIIGENTVNIEQSKLAEIMARFSGETIERMVSMLKQFLLGIRGD